MKNNKAHTPLTVRIAEALALRRESLRDIEAATGISKATLSRIARKRPFSTAHLDALLAHLDLQVTCTGSKG